LLIAFESLPRVGCFISAIPLIVRILLTVMILSSTASSQELRSVRWIGLGDDVSIRKQVFATRQPPIKFGSRSELVLEVQRLQIETRKALIGQGYYFASVDSVLYLGDSLLTDLELYVTPGHKSVLQRIETTGAPIDQAFRFESVPGEVLQPSVLESDIQRLLQRFEALGYPLTTIHVVSIDEDSAGLVVNLSIEQNGAARIGRLSVEGNTTTRAHVITREFGLREGELLIPSRLEQGREALERLGYFETVEPPKIFLLDDTTVEVRITVAEARTTTIDAVLGYNPPRIPTESGYITGLVDLGFRNIAGTARDAAVHYSSLSQGTQRLSAQYREPWIFNYPLHINLSFDQFQQDSSYVSTQMLGGLTYSLTQSLDVNASLLYDRIVPTDLPETPFIAFDSRKLLTLLSATYDSRDELLAPTSGLVLKLSGNYGSKRLNGPARFLSDSLARSSTLSELALDVHVFQPTFSEKLILALGLHAKRTAVFGSTLDQSDLTRLGGARTLRGYRENELLASRFAYINAEYRFLTARQSYLFLFTDAGRLERAPIVGDPSTVRISPLSYGIGVQQLTPVGVLTLSIGLSRGESFDRAKVHFGLLTRI
jgi:outer membrane protein assembly factor BamA